MVPESLIILSFNFISTGLITSLLPILNSVYVGLNLEESFSFKMFLITSLVLFYSTFNTYLVSSFTILPLDSK